MRERERESDRESSGEAVSPERREKRQMRSSHWNPVLFKSTAM